MKAIRISETGGPGVMKFVEVDVPKPGPGEVRLRNWSAGTVTPGLSGPQCASTRGTA